MTEHDSLSRYVRDALSHFYDPSFLQTCALADMLPAANSAVEGPHIQRIIRDAIECLRPAASVPTDRPEWLGYLILKRRYLEGQNTVYLCDDLALSLATMYRHQQQAIEALADILDKRFLNPRDRSPSRENTALAETDENSMREAVERMFQTREPVALPTVIESVSQVFAALAMERGVELRIDIPQTDITVYGDKATFHQIFLCALTGVSKIATSSSLQLSVDMHLGDGTLCTVHIDFAGESPDYEKNAPELDLCRRLLQGYDGRLWMEHDCAGRSRLCFTLPRVKPASILVVEDHDDTIRLYRRYLQRLDCSLHVAVSGSELWRYLETMRPSLIILDVLMPEEDGWMILQRLKILPDTSDIPVIVYSVVPQPSLALALGASAVLLKPIEEEALLTAVRRVLSLSDNPV